MIKQKLLLELLAKELRLQRNNAMFAFAVVLLGFIGLLSVKQAGPNVMSFSAEDISASLFLLVLVPALVVILPIMAGSTAAASERALGVWAWQAALPLNWLWVVAAKTLVVGGTCIVLAGILPYLLQFWMPFELHVLSHYFRNTWTGWLGLICAAIGFYSGALARDDYHGLLISVVPLCLLLFVMWIADPFLLVSPIHWGSPIWNERTLAVRLLLIALVLVVFAGRLLKRAGQRRHWQIVIQAVVLAPFVIMLTLWNLVTERTSIQKTVDFPHGGTWTAFGTTDVRFGMPWPVATVPKWLGSNANGRILPYAIASINLEDSSDIGSDRFVVGQIERGSSQHYFLYTRNGELREFPQACGFLLGYTNNGKWLWVEPTLKSQALCGPFGITLSSYALPDKWFDSLRKMIGFTQTRTSRRIASEAPTDFATAVELATPADQVVTIIRSHAVVWKDGKTQIPNLWSTSSLIQRRDFPGPSGSSADPYEIVPGSLIGRQLAGDRIAIGFPSSARPLATAILKPAQNLRVYELAGWTTGDIDGVSDDDKWARKRQDSGTAYSRHFNIVEVVDEFTTNTTLLRQWDVSAPLASDANTSVTLHWNYGNVPVLTTENGTFTWCRYQKFGPVTIENQLGDDNFPYESGLAMLNLDTGSKNLVPAPMPWSASATLMLQKPNASSLPGTYQGSRFPVWNKKFSQLALVQDDYLGFISLKDSWLLNRNLKMQYAHLPGLTGGAFLRHNEFLATDGTDLWVIPLSE